MRRTLLGLLALAALIGSACSLITRFDDSTQACDDQAPVGEQCLSGSSCVAGHCVSGDAGLLTGDSGAVTDAGGDAGPGDAGTHDGGSGDGGTGDGGTGDGGH